MSVLGPFLVVGPDSGFVPSQHARRPQQRDVAYSESKCLLMQGSKGGSREEED